LSPASGDLSRSAVNEDIWLVKLDSTGKVEWEKSYRGSGSDNLNTLVATPYGGYLVGGSSSSSKEGDKSQVSRGKEDYWVLWIDRRGNITGDQTYGSNGRDLLREIVPTADGNFLLCGMSDGDRSGEKSQQGNGLMDYWIVKINQYGTKLWDRSLGGDGLDMLSTAISTEDGGFLLGGLSTSQAKGDKSKSTGIPEFWLVKVDEAGNRQWDQIDSGNFLSTIHRTQDGGYLIGGSARGELGASNAHGYQLTRLDAKGNSKWKRVYRGPGEDNFRGLIPTADGGYILAGSSNSPQGGDKSQNAQRYDLWLIKVDKLGKKQLDWTYGGIGDDYCASIVSMDNGFILTGESNSPPGGDKSEAAKGETDFWVLRIDTPRPTITTQPVSVSVCPDRPGSLSLAASGTNLTYQWQVLTSWPDGWEDLKDTQTMQGVTTNQLVGIPPGPYTNTSFRCVLTDSYGSVTISEEAIITRSFIRALASPTNRDYFCQGTQAVLYSYAQGLPPVRYEWTGPNGFRSQETILIIPITSTKPESYTFTVTDGIGCTQSAVTSYTISESPVVQARVQQASSCTAADGSIHLEGSGGTGTLQVRLGQEPFENQWSFSSLSPGVYQATIRDARGCQASVPVQLGYQTAVAARILSKDVSCEDKADGSAELELQGGKPPFSFQWSTNQTTPLVTGLPTGPVSVTITDGDGCKTTAFGSIRLLNPRPGSPTISVSSSGLLANGEQPGTYQWYQGTPPDGILLTGATEAAYNPTQSGPYYVTFVSTAGCHSLPSAPFNFIVTSEEKGPNVLMSGWPNPSTDVLQVQWHQTRAGNTTLTLLNNRSQACQVITGYFGSGLNSSVINLIHLPAGVYLLQVQTGNQTQVLRIVKK